MTHIPEIGTENRYKFSDVSHMQFGTEFFWYSFLVTNRTMLYFGASLWYQFSGTGFWC